MKCPVFPAAHKNATGYAPLHAVHGGCRVDVRRLVPLTFLHVYYFAMAWTVLIGMHGHALVIPIIEGVIKNDLKIS